MKKWSVLLTVFLLVATSIALAVPAKKILEYKYSTMATVIFDGTLHKGAGLKCGECHNPDMFPKMKQGTVKITMDNIYASKQCGVCHNGTKAFDAKTNCNRCHKK